MYLYDIKNILFVFLYIYIMFLNRFACTPYQLGRAIQTIKKQKMYPIIDYVTECNQNDDNIDKTLYILNKGIDNYPHNTFSLKLSSIYSKSELQNFKNFDNICRNAICNESKVMIDGESNIFHSEINLLSDEMMRKYNKHTVYVYKTYQMYRKDGLIDFMHDISSPRDYFIGFKLVRGAYLNQDKKLGVLCESYNETNEQYNKAIEAFTKYKKDKDILLCATHNIDSIEHAMCEYFQSGHNLEFAQFMHMNNDLSRSLASQGFKIYKYIPYGNFKECISYLL